MREQTVVAAVFSFVWAFVCNATLDILQTGGDFARFVTYEVMQTPWLVLTSTTIVWLALVLLLGLTGRLFVSCGVLFGLAIIVGFVNHTKLHIRGEPLYPADLTFVGNSGFLVDMVSVDVLVALGLLVTTQMFILLLLGRVLRSRYPRIRRGQSPIYRHWLVGRVAAAAVAVLGLTHVHGFNEPGNLARTAYDEAGAQWAFWRQDANYLRHGVVAGFLYNLDVVAMERPPGYSRDRMMQIVQRYSAEADRINRDADPGRLRDLNVIAVLSEAFTDPTTVPGVRLQRDPIPYTRDLMSRTISGHMYTQYLGGGTANMEFETLTGQSMSQFQPQMHSPYPTLVRHHDDYPSIVGYLQRLGHNAVGIHPYDPTIYKREDAYRSLGFDAFLDESSLPATRIDNAEFIADSAAFEETVRQLERSEGPDFVNVVTMQNHYPAEGVYADPMQVAGVEGETARELPHYARGLEHSDQALRAFIHQLQELQEPTLVVFYGDHQPAIWQGPVYERAGEHAMRQTPFFFWSNVKQLGPSEVPLLSPIYFMPMSLRAMGAPVPPYYALLLEMQRHVSAMEQDAQFDTAGRPLSAAQRESASRLLEDYRLVQYDFSIGERYAVQGLFDQAP